MLLAKSMCRFIKTSADAPVFSSASFINNTYCILNLLDLSDIISLKYSIMFSAALARRSAPFRLGQPILRSAYSQRSGASAARCIGSYPIHLNRQQHQVNSGPLLAGDHTFPHNALHASFNYMPNRMRHSLPMNTVIVFVPHQEAWVVERMGKFHKILEPGLNVLVPIIDRVRYVQSLKEMAFEIVPQSAITADNVTIQIDGVLYLKVFDPYKASYNIEDPEFGITQLAQTTMRSEIGKIQLDAVFRERESLNSIIVSAINNATSPWGITCLRYEIRDIKIPNRVQEAMQLQVEAERKRRARILESEGARDAEINVANGEATAIMARAKAKADALTSVSNAIKADAAAFLIAEQYVKAFSNLAKTTNTLILPADAGDINKMVAQAFQVYKTMSVPPSGGGSRLPTSNGGVSKTQLKLDGLDSSEGSESYLSDIEEALREKASALSATNKSKATNKNRR